MGDGPIRAERDAWKPPRVSTTDVDRVCFIIPPARRAYCGRRTPKATTPNLTDINCADCEAALRADGRPTTP